MTGPRVVDCIPIADGRIYAYITLPQVGKVRFGTRLFHDFSSHAGEFGDEQKYCGLVTPKASCSSRHGRTVFSRFKRLSLLHGIGYN